MKNDLLDRLKKKLDSDDSEYMNNYFKRIGEKEEIRKSQVVRFWNRYNVNQNNIDDVIGRIIKKYESDEYKDGWLDWGIEPPEDLYFLLFDVADRYGRLLTQEELDRYVNIFTVEIYILGNYVFNKMNGQGTVVNVDKIE